MPRTKPPEGSLPRVLGEVIREARLSRGLAQEDLAALADCSAIIIRRYEFGDRSPSWEGFIRIARALDMTPSMLMSRLDDWGLEKPKKKRAGKRKAEAA